MSEPVSPALPNNAFDSTRGREAALKRWKGVRENAKKDTGARTGTMPGGGESQDALDGLLARDTLAAIASDTSAPHASRVAAARALGERVSGTGKGGRELDPVTVRRLVLWAEERIPHELAAPSSSDEQLVLADSPLS